MPKMRAKMELASITQHATCEVLRFHAVSAKSYPADGSDEDNSYAKFSPQASLEITIANPALIGKFAAGEKYYVDFSKAD